MISFANTFIVKNTGISTSFDDDFNRITSKYVSETDELRDIEQIQKYDENFVTEGTLPAVLNNTLVSKSPNSVYYENPFKMPASILCELNGYKSIYNKSIVEELSHFADPKATEEVKTGDKTEKLPLTFINSISTVGSKSLFNPNVAVQVRGFLANTPLSFIGEGDTTASVVDDDFPTGRSFAEKASKELKDKFTGVDMVDNNSTDLYEVISGSNVYGAIDVGDCSIKTLVELSNTNKNDTGNLHYGESTLGMAKFRYADFMYCKDLGKVSNNHLIVLRKFPHPIGDNIYSATTSKAKSSGDEDISPDIGRLISWFDTEDNKLEDICKYDYQMSWKQLNAEIEQQNSKEDQPGLLPGIINLASPSYRNQVANGMAGGQNTILNWISSKTRIFASEHAGTAAENRTGGAFSNYDTNYRVYTPKNTVQDNHLYEGKLTFKQTITLKFSYKLRAYDNINPRAAFIDLIGNIQAVTFQKGTFWGGSRKLIGPQQNKQGWKKANALIDKAWSKASDFLGDIINGTTDYSALMGQFTNLASSIGGQISSAMSNLSMDSIEEFAKDLGTEAGNLIKSGASKLSAAGAGTMMKGMLKNKLGRPQIYAWHALVSGDNVGFWHLSVGNPRNPFMSIGNLIMTNSSIQHSGPLGIDDFPTELSVTCTLEHGKSRDATDIGKMYTMGKYAIYLSKANRPVEAHEKTKNAGRKKLTLKNV